jgi:hypothetical protein
MSLILFMKLKKKIYLNGGYDMAAKTYPTILKYGTQANYDAIESKDSSVLYFCTDTKKIYKGTIDFTDSVVLESTKPQSGQIVGKLYIFADTGTAEVYANNAWHVVSYPIATTIAASSDDVHVATAKAVYDAIQSAISGDGVVNSVVASSTEGYINVTTAGVADDVVVHGVVTTPSYNASTRTFTFPVSDGNDVVVSLGTDIFIDPDANNRYEDGNIYLYLNDGTASEDPTELVIPVTGLITDYFGTDTDTVQVDIDNSTHEVTATVKIRPDVAGTFTNSLQYNSTGLYVDLSAYATTSDLNTEITRVEGKADANASAITTLNGNASTAGSVANSIATAIADLDATVSQTAGADGLALSVTEVDGVVTGVSGSIAANTYDAYGAAAAVQGATSSTVKDVEDDAAAAQAKADQNELDIAALAAASTQWGTF